MAPPPKAESRNKVLSRTRHFPLIARDLSAMQTIAEIRLITIKYNIKNLYLLSKTDHRFNCNSIKRLFQSVFLAFR